MPSASETSLLYLDSSAIVKLVVAEPETPALMTFLAAWPQRVSSVIARVEVLRAVARARPAPAVRRRAHRVLARIALVSIDEPVLAQAVRVRPGELRTLDALHLATARSLDGVAGIVAYDKRLLRAAALARIRTWAPA